MTSDGRTLKQLSDEATPGPWGIALGDTIATKVEQISRGHARYRDIIAHFDDTDYDEEFVEPRAGGSLKADIALIVELVNAYREGRLVEAPERELCTACALPCDRYGCDCVDLAACNAAKLISQSSSVSSLPTREDKTE